MSTTFNVMGKNGYIGKLGEMLAPVMPVNQLFLAIQNHRNQEVQSLIISQQFDLRKACEGGYMALHVACRYNNVQAIDMMVQQGIHIEMLDNHGNSALHYAAKAGHLDLCKMLIERGCSPARRNSSNQTPYDATDSHLVRQYLLPLIFKYENGQMNQVPVSGHEPQYGMMEQHAYTTQPAYPQPTPEKAAPPAFNPPSYPPSAYSQPSMPAYSQPAGMSDISLSHELPTSYMPPNQAPPYQTPSMSHQPPTYNQPPTNMNSMSADNSNVRKIKADGFHSSASDPQLQMKYGHIKPSINIAPPPTGSLTGNNYSAYGATTNSSAVYNRYPVYDPLAPVPPPPASTMAHSPAIQQPQYPPANVVPPPSMVGPPQMSQQTPYNMAYQQQPNLLACHNPSHIYEDEVVAADASSGSVL